MHHRARCHHAVCASAAQPDERRRTRSPRYSHPCTASAVGHIHRLVNVHARWHFVFRASSSDRVGHGEGQRCLNGPAKAWFWPSRMAAVSVGRGSHPASSAYRGQALTRSSDPPTETQRLEKPAHPPGPEAKTYGPAALNNFGGGVKGASRVSESLSQMSRESWSHHHSSGCVTRYTLYRYSG